jgi:hypothetical protein
MATAAKPLSTTQALSSLINRHVTDYHAPPRSLAMKRMNGQLLVSDELYENVFMLHVDFSGQAGLG